MTEPPSRQYEAYKANGWPNQVAEYDPHGVAAGDMYSECDGCRSRDWFGPNPWSEPGTASHLDFVMGGTGGNILGTCGASPSRDNDYNTPLDGHWGMNAKTTYKAGDVIDVSSSPIPRAGGARRHTAAMAGCARARPRSSSTSSRTRRALAA